MQTIRVLGVNLEDDPWFMVREFSDLGDLTQYLQDHVAESSLSKTADIPTLRLAIQYSRQTIHNIHIQLWSPHIYGNSNCLRNEMP